MFFLYFRCDAQYGCVGHGMYHFLSVIWTFFSLISWNSFAGINELTDTENYRSIMT